MKRIFAYAKKPVGAVMMRPILEALLARGGYEVLAAERRFGRHADGVFREVGLEGVKAFPKWAARFTAFDLYLSADFGVVARRSRLKAHVFHGVSFRNHAVHQNALRYDLLLLAGPYMLRRFREAGIATDSNQHRFVVVGVPKLDALAAGRYSRDEVLRRLGLDPARRTLLYAPTWSRKMSSLERHGAAVAEALARTGHNVIVKLHDNSLDPRKAGQDWAAVLGRLRSPTFRLALEADVVPLMAAADLLVSDASSVANEFTLLDRPILFLEIEELDRKLKPKADLETWGRKAGDVVPGPEALPAAVERALAEPERHSETRRALARDLFHEPGRATEHAVRAIEEAMREAAR